MALRIFQAAFVISSKVPEEYCCIALTLKCNSIFLMSPQYLQPAMANQAVHSLPVTLVVFIMNSHLEKWQDFSADFGTQPFHSCRGQHRIEFGVWFPVFLSVTKHTMTSLAEEYIFCMRAKYVEHLRPLSHIAWIQRQVSSTVAAAHHDSLQLRGTVSLPPK